MTVRRRRRPSPRHLALIPLVSLYVVPIYVVVSNAFRRQEAISASPFAVPPDGLTLANFEKVIADPGLNIAGAYVLSGLICVTVMALVAVFGAGLGYIIARLRPPWSVRLSILLLVSFILPPQVTIIPVIKVLAFAGLAASPVGLIAYDVAATVPFAALVYSVFVRDLPIALEEAARIDGASRLRIFWSVVLPLMKPATISILLFVGVGNWNDFVTPNIILAGDAQTITTGIYASLGKYSSDWGSVFATVLIASVPVLIVFLSAQKQLLGGITRGAVIE